ncbi:hypothetical protein NKH77_19410 [Streptomyces sp. M19]
MNREFLRASVRGGDRRGPAEATTYRRVREGHRLLGRHLADAVAALARVAVPGRRGQGHRSPSGRGRRRGPGPRCSDDTVAQAVTSVPTPCTRPGARDRRPGARDGHPNARDRRAGAARVTDGPATVTGARDRRPDGPARVTDTRRS